jgi:hypothetical protein
MGGKMKCIRPDCARNATTKGYCGRHYRLARRHGTPYTVNEIMTAPLRSDSLKRCDMTIEQQQKLVAFVRWVQE